MRYRPGNEARMLAAREARSPFELSAQQDNMVQQELEERALALWDACDESVSDYIRDTCDGVDVVRIVRDVGYIDRIRRDWISYYVNSADADEIAAIIEGVE